MCVCCRVRTWLQVIRRTLPREVMCAILLTTAITFLFHASGPTAAWAQVVFSESKVEGVAKAWTLSATMASFMLSFFLSQSYALWRSVYSVTRRIQGRLNDLGLLCNTFAQRDATTGEFTPEAAALLETVARYIRLFHLLFYASVTTRYSSLKTPQGLKALVNTRELTSDERDGLLESSLGHDAIVGWLAALFDTAVSDGRLSASTCRASGASPIAVQMALENKLTELRATYQMLSDELSARMPLAYVQLVQILTDGLILFTPIALIPSVGPFGVVAGTAVVTLWYSSLVTLAKLFLDPLNNEVGERGGDPGIGGMDVATLLQETNLSSRRWCIAAQRLPSAVRPVTPPAAADPPSSEGDFVEKFRNAFGAVAKALPEEKEAEMSAGGDEDASVPATASESNL